jgi:hypothetical protein
LTSGGVGLSAQEVKEMMRRRGMKRRGWRRDVVRGRVFIE